MIKNLYIKFAFNLTILLTVIFFYNFLNAEEIYFDLSEDSIELKTDFNGKEIIIFGLLKNDHETLLTIKGPPSKMRIQKKERYFGICFGMQMAVVEAARNLAGLNNASSSEFGKCENPVVGLLKEWMKDDIIYEMGINYDMGGTMRLGAFDCKLLEGSKANKIYNSSKISERHRHRYEVNINYKDMLEKVGLTFSGMSPNGALPEIVEISNHPWFLGVQFHPELKSKPFDPHPLFKSFIEATIKYSRLV